MPFHSSSRVMEKPPVYRTIKLGIPVDKCSECAVKPHSAIPRRIDEITEEQTEECHHRRRRLQRAEKNLLLERSISLNELKNGDELTSSRSMSASNLMALSDPNLCLTFAAPKRDYVSIDTVFAKRRLKLTSLIHTYYHQLTEGCHSNSCVNLFCASNARQPKRSYGAAVLISIELSSQGPFNLCKRDELHKTCVPPKDAFLSCSKQNHTTQPFMERLFSATPFKCVFLSSPMSPPVRSASSRRLSSSQSLSCLHLSTSNDVVHLIDDNPVSDHPIGPSFSIKNTLLQAFNYIQSTLRSSLLSSESSEDDDKSDMWLFGPTTAVNQDDLQRFEEITAHNIRANRPSSEHSLSLSHLSLDMLHNVLSDLQECKDPTFLRNTIRTVFSSSCHLNSSFTTCVEGNVCIGDAREGFDLIKQHDRLDYGFVEVLHSTLEIHLLGLSHLPSLPYGNTNQLILALLVPTITHNATLCLAWCKVLRGINQSERDHMTSVLVAMDTSYLMRLQQGFQNLLSLSLAKGQSFGSYQLSLCSALDLLFSTFTKHPEGDTAALQMFCNPALSDTIDIRNDFALYCARKRAIRYGKNAAGGHACVASYFDYPFLLEPLFKIKAIHLHAMNQMRVEYSNAIVQQSRVQKVQKTLDISPNKILVSNDIYSSMCPYLLLEIRRTHLVEDALVQVHAKVSDLKKPLKVRYVKGGEFGLDMGGLQKEFFQLATEHLFSDDFGMFLSCEKSRTSWINADSLESPHLFEFVGILIGLAIYNGVILGVRFPMAFYKKLLEQPMDLSDLMEIEPSIAQSLKHILTLDSEDLNELGLTFQICRQSRLGVDLIVVHDLILDGDQVPVTIDNRSLFVNLYVHVLLDSCIKTQFLSILSGVHQVCDDEVFKLFRADELELVICGCAELDFSALRSTTIYRDGYTADHPTIADFWQVVDSFDMEQRQQLLMFVTGSSRVPLDGLKSLAFHIQRNGPDTDNLPTAMTCFNRLLLPEYNSIDKLECKLSLAVENSKGFGLT